MDDKYCGWCGRPYAERPAGTSSDIPILGQEAICSYGLGRVISFDFECPNNYIEVKEHISGISRKWDRDNVVLVKP